MSTGISARSKLRTASGRRRNLKTWSSPGALHTPEILYVRARSAAWLAEILKQKLPLEADFFACLQWAGGDLRRPLQAVMQATETAARQPDLVKARRALREALTRPRDKLYRVFDSLYEEHPCLEASIRDAAQQVCAAVVKSCSRPAATYSAALERLEHIFGLDAECRLLCEFLFINQNFKEIEDYFEDRLRLDRYQNRSILARMLGMKETRLQSCLAELHTCGLFNADRFRLQDCLLPFWEAGEINAQAMFSRPLSGAALPLEAFQVASDDVAHARKLLEQNGKAPVHILLYGAPGTGKSSFAAGMAQACGVKAWAVTGREQDGDGDRRASLAACLHIAAKHQGAFVLVDEAERLLDTDSLSGRTTKDKAWLNAFLEQPGRRIIWITNQIDHIDPAVRRRFSFSIHFEKLGVRERTNIWRQVAARHRVARRLSNEQITALARAWPVEAAVINSAVSQAKQNYPGKNDFPAALERVLRAQTTLQRDGRKPRHKAQTLADYTPDGACLEEGSAAGLAATCRRIDAAMRDNVPLRPGSATMLFYGPPGTGKTALARFIAGQTDRECLVERAADLLNPFVGVTEQQIAGAFARAEREGAVLVIDEADSFLYSRDIAQRSWETSMVNAFLTALEECRCFCICTTNRRDSLDAAAMRRFSHKVAFSYAGPAQVRALYAGLLAPLCADALPAAQERELLRLNRLTPGDFHAVRARCDPLFADTSQISHTSLIAALAQEQALKLEQRRVGF